MQTIFQSTLPAGEATLITVIVAQADEDFNPRFPRGKRPEQSAEAGSREVISIHASRGGSDDHLYIHAVFQKISIHASRGGSDAVSRPDRWRAFNFNPRFPRGKRLLHHREPGQGSHFNPRFPRGKRQITASPSWRKWTFQSTLPAGEATTARLSFWATSSFQSTLPAGEAT